MIKWNLNKLLLLAPKCVLAFQYFFAHGRKIEQHQWKRKTTGIFNYKLSQNVLLYCKNNISEFSFTGYENLKRFVGRTKFEHTIFVAVRRIFS